MSDASSQRNIKLLMWFNFLLDFRFYLPIMIIYFEQITDSYALAMSVLAITMVSSAALEVPMGIFSDVVGRRKTIITGSFASLFSVIAYAVGGTYAILVFGGVLEGVGRSLFSGNNDALLHDTLAESDRRSEYQEFLGRVSSAFQLALAISAVLGGLFASISFAIVMWISVLPKLAMVVLSFYFVEPKVHLEESDSMWSHLGEAWRNIRKNPRLRLLSIGQIIGFSVGEAAFHFRTVFIELLWPIWAIGFARVISHITAAFSFFFAGKLLRRFGEKRLLLGGIGISETLNGTALLLASFVSPILMGTTSIFFGVNTVSMNGMMQREFTDAQRSTMGSLVAFGGSIGFAIASTALGALADAIGVREALLVSTVFAYTPMFFFWVAFRNTGKADADQTSSVNGAVIQ